MRVDFTINAKKLLKKLDTQAKKQIKELILDIEQLDNPKSKGKPLKGNLKGLWRYRSGDYRIICKIEDDKLLILVLYLGHRKEIYKH